MDEVNDLDPFEAGFNKSLGIEAEAVDEPAEESASDEVIEEAIEVEQEEQAPNEIDEIRERIAQFEGHKDWLEKVKGFDPEQANRRTEQVFGKLGQLEQELKQLKAEPQRPELTAASFPRLNAEYDDIAVAIAEDLKGIMLERKVVEQAPVDMQALQSVLNDAVNLQSENLRKEFEQKAFDRDLKALSRMHPDKDQILQSDDWGKWLNSKGESFLKELSENDTDLLYVSDVLNEFKSAKQTELEKQQAIEAKKQQKTNRLQQAVMPKTTAPASHTRVLSEDDAFNAGFKKALGQR